MMGNIIDGDILFVMLVNEYLTGLCWTLGGYTYIAYYKILKTSVRNRSCDRDIYKKADGLSFVYNFDTLSMKVVAKRLCRGKWACNNGQACIAPDYVLVEESIRSELVIFLQSF